MVLLPKALRKSVVIGLTAVPIVSVTYSALFAGRGLLPISADRCIPDRRDGDLPVGQYRQPVRQRTQTLPSGQQRTLRIGLWLVAIGFVLALPILGSYPSEVLVVTGIFVLMGLGLNIVVGYAGLLDLGYVAFFAIGAYVMAIITSPEITWFPFSGNFWLALPFAVLAATLAGVILGIPVLNMRGDYLAIVTLGFGEIIRLIAISDWLKPLIGGSNGHHPDPQAESSLVSPSTIRRGCTTSS